MRKKLGEILVSAGKINDTQLQQALDYHKKKNIKLGEAIIELNFITEHELLVVLSQQLSLELVDLDRVNINADVVRSIPKEVAKKYCLIPINEKDGKLIVAMNDPLNVYAIDDIAFLTHKKLSTCLAERASVEKLIDLYYNKQDTDKALDDLKKEYSIQFDDKIDQMIINDIQNAPAVRLTNSIITQAVAIKASDIHLEPFEKYVIVRYRTNGILSENTQIPLNLYTSVSTRIKIMAGINIAERRIPQDGRIEQEINAKVYDFRVSTLPTIYGEKIVIRILDRNGSVFDRTLLGLTPHEDVLMDKIIRAPYGIVLLTGPTGSGKTTTLYTMLKELNTVDKNIVTIEDPVEYRMNGVNQVQVNNKAGLTFATGLRSVLRQDPDIVMVGEIRDEETAQIAVRASITGHLVLSTLHTNDAPGSVTRLVDMGIPSYLVAEAVVAVIAQRLVRVLCPACRIGYMANNLEMELLSLKAPIKLYKENGCHLCNKTGYVSRTAIHEMLYVDKAIKIAIETGRNTEEIRDIALKNGMISLFDSCKQLVVKGDTTISEMVKTVYARD